MIQKLLPLAPEMGAPPRCQRALSAIIAEDGITGEKLTELVEEAKAIFPHVEELTLYFRSRSGQIKDAWTLVQEFFLTEWKPSFCNAGRLEAGDHGLLVFVVLRLAPRP